MSEGLDTIIYPVRDLPAARATYAALLGVEPYLDAPYYVAFNAGGQDVGLDPNGQARGIDRPVGYWRVDDIEAKVRTLTEAGAKTVREVRDVGGGKLIAVLEDADGNLIGLSQPPS
jgi:predicted enzyme related to lactoylglutathione lyase